MGAGEGNRGPGQQREGVQPPVAHGRRIAGSRSCLRMCGVLRYPCNFSAYEARID